MILVIKSNLERKTVLKKRHPVLHLNQLSQRENKGKDLVQGQGQGQGQDKDKLEISIKCNNKERINRSVSMK
jgi:hypothetical protein